jgi:hypothetical protein
VAFAKASPILTLLLVLLLVWQGGLKRETRTAFDLGYASSDPLERIAQFTSRVRQSIPDLFADPEPYVEQLVERISYITFFSNVLDYVPAREPHARGDLLRVAVANTIMPRYLFPEKPILLSDSYYTNRFAGVRVADETTSISIGYMAEFYADWGLRGMWISIFLYGCWMGLMAGLLRALTPVPALYPGVLIVAMLNVADFEHQFMKGLAALNASVAFTIVLLLVLRPWLVRLLDPVAVDPLGDAAPRPDAGGVALPQEAHAG